MAEKWEIKQPWGKKQWYHLVSCIGGGVRGVGGVWRVGVYGGRGEGGRGRGEGLGREEGGEGGEGGGCFFG